MIHKSITIETPAGLYAMSILSDYPSSFLKIVVKDCFDRIVLGATIKNYSFCTLKLYGVTRADNIGSLLGAIERELNELIVVNRERLRDFN